MIFLWRQRSTVRINYDKLFYVYSWLFWWIGRGRILQEIIHFWPIFNLFFCQITQGLYSETGFHTGMDHNFVCLWRRHNCKSQVIDLSLSALISWFFKSIIGFLNHYNLPAMISTSLIINLQWAPKFFLAVLEEIYNNVVPHWSAV